MTAQQNFVTMKVSDNWKFSSLCKWFKTFKIVMF